MAKVFLELESGAITDLSEEKIQQLESNNIPYEKDGESIYLISKRAYESGVSVYSREYDENYSKFWMQIVDSIEEGEIGMGEGALSDETLKVLYETFGDSLSFELYLGCGGDSESLSVQIIFDKNKNTYLFE